MAKRLITSGQRQNLKDNDTKKKLNKGKKAKDITNQEALDRVKENMAAGKF